MNNFEHVNCATEMVTNICTLLYAFFWVIPRRLNFICRRFGTLCLLHLHRQVDACNSARTYLPMKMEQCVFRNVDI